VEHAVTFAKQSPYPPPEAAYTDLYAQTRYALTPGDAA
jgi:TPP-dependent pyruvate/acetoin dehydrogenase alpha subunit